MDAILKLISLQFQKIWQLVTDFTIPFGDEQIPFVYVISACLFFAFFIKMSRLILDVVDESREYVRRDELNVQRGQRLLVAKKKEFANKAIKNGHISAKDFRENRESFKVQNRKRGY
ncbi:MAG: hypothetical protein PUD34_01420 [bacterium]|mgnify:CR=1 FL=1|nr:hypothetical protein [bacterium]